MSTLASLMVKLGLDASAFHKGVGQAEGSAGKLLGTLGKLAAPIAIGAGVVAIGKAVWDAGQQADEAMDTIAIKTGATGLQLDTLGKDYEAVFKNVPNDAETVASAIAALNQKTEMTGPALQKTTTNLTEMSRLLGGDATRNAELYGRLMGDWSIGQDDAAATADKLFVATQKTGVGSEKLMENLVKYGAPLRNFGYGFDEATALLSSFEKEGVNGELVMGGLRTAAGKFADQGKPLNKGLLDTFNAIKNTTDASKALSIGMDIFGARAGPDFVAAIREGRFSVDDIMESMKGAEGAILKTADATADFPEKLQVLKNKVSVALAPLGLKMMDVITGAVEKAGPIIERVIPIIENVIRVVQMLFSAIQAAFAGGDTFSSWLSSWGGMSNLREWFGPDVAASIRNVLAEVYSLAGAAGTFVNGTLIPLVTTYLPQVKMALLAVVGAFAALKTASAVASTIGTVGKTIGLLTNPIGIVIAIVALLAAAWAGNWGGIRDKAAEVWAFLQPIFAQVVAWLQTNIPVAVQFLSNLWSTVLLPAIQTVWNFIQANVLPLFAQVVTWLQTNIPVAVQFLSTVWTTILKPAIEAVWLFISTKLLPLLTGLANLIVAVLKKAVEGLAWVWEFVLKPALEKAWKFIEENILPVIETLVTKVREALGPALEWLKTNVLDPLVEVFNKIGDAISNVVGWLGKAADAVSNFDIGGWMSGVFGVGGDTTVNVAGMPGYAGGTMFHPGGLALVGERGPELVSMPRGSQVWNASMTAAMGRNAEPVSSNYTISIGSIYAPGGNVEQVRSAAHEGVTEAARALGLI